MKKLLLTIFVLFLTISNAFATTTQDALKFFNNYVSAANSYSPAVLTYYSDNAKIIRQVIKPNGQLVNVPFSVNDYKKQMKISQSIAKLRKYKNYYSNIKVMKVSDGFEITADRKPSLSNDKLKTIMVVQPQRNGKWLIVSETMQTREQIFLKYAK